MTSSSEVLSGRVVRGVDVTTLRPARLGADLRTSPFVHAHRVDPRLMDPSLEVVVAEAVAIAEQDARAAGWAAGHDAGHAAAMELVAQSSAEAARVRLAREQADSAALRERAATALAALAVAVERLDRSQAPVREEIERRSATLAVDIAEALVGHHLAVGECAARDAVARALRLAPDATAVTVRLAPADAELLAAGWPGSRAVTLVADPDIEPGGCVVDSGMRRIDAQAGTALRRVREVLGA